MPCWKQQHLCIRGCFSLLCSEGGSAEFILTLSAAGFWTQSAISTGLLVGALDTVLDSNARVTPFRILLQIPGSQTSWVIASGEPTSRPLRFRLLGCTAALKSFSGGAGLVFLCVRSRRRGGEQALGLAGPQPASLPVRVWEQGGCCQLRQRESQGVRWSSARRRRISHFGMFWCGFRRCSNLLDLSLPVD